MGLFFVAIVAMGALFAPLLTDYSPNLQNLEILAQGPSMNHILGTDHFGRDVLSRLLYGARISLGIGLMAAFIATVVGTLVGVIAGLFKGWTDWILMRLVDVLMGFPRLFVILLVVAFSTPSIWTTMIVLGLLSWMEIARIVRGEVLVIREKLYIKAAIALNLKTQKIIGRYILPNLAGQVIVSVTLLIGTMIIVEASLSFLGLGIQPPDASWGTILNDGRADPLGTWWISVFGGLFIVITVIGFNLLGDGLRDYFDPRVEK